jgi:hypothetical protein
LRPCRPIVGTVRAGRGRRCLDVFLARTGLDQRLNVASSADGTKFQHKTTLGQTTDTAPGLAFAAVACSCCGAAPTPTDG